ncbi:MAG: hypothetical protein DWH80_07335 [Planctomycetota bacterium]|nr:MAG: hypothetical protein DWH80_07335 [Planctomycetota bacterium]
MCEACEQSRPARFPVLRGVLFAAIEDRQAFRGFLHIQASIQIAPATESLERCDEQFHPHQALPERRPPIRDPSRRGVRQLRESLLRCWSWSSSKGSWLPRAVVICRSLRPCLDRWPIVDQKLLSTPACCQ